MLDTRLFGKILPSKNLPLIFDSLRRHLALEVPEPFRDTVDLAIKDRVRLLRLPNTIHEKSKLYKVGLSLEELRRLSPAEIRECAGSPRPMRLTDETGFLPYADVKENPAAGQLFKHVRRQLNKLTRKPFRLSLSPSGGFGPAHVSLRCPANDLGKPHRTRLPQQLRDSPGFRTSPAWGSAKKKQTINYLSGTRETVSSFHPTSFVTSHARLISIDFPTDTVAGMTSEDASALYQTTSRAESLCLIAWNWWRPNPRKKTPLCSSCGDFLCSRRCAFPSRRGPVAVRTR